MKVAVVGSRTLGVKRLGDYLPDGVTEIVTGGAAGVDLDAEEYGMENGLKVTLFLPEYEKYRRSAPLVRNRELIEYSDIVIAFWDGESRGTKYVIDTAKKLGKDIRVYKVNKSPDPLIAESDRIYDEYSLMPDVIDPQVALM